MKFDWGQLAVRRRELLPFTSAEDMSRRTGAFACEEDGTATILSFFVVITILLMAGLGVDTMRQEMERTHLQATLDAAVLAGAGAPTGSEVADVKAIVEDYFDKNDMSEYLNEIQDGDIITSLNATSVYAEGELTVDTYLLHLSGVDELKAVGAAQAEVATPKLEVAMVLDVSGSMWDKLDELQTAANSFVTTILNGSDPGDAVISVVPFAFNVTPSPEMFDALTVNQTHEYSTCLRFADSDYSDMSIDPDVSYEQEIFTSLYGGFNDFNDFYRSCYNDDNAEILPYSINETALHTHINAMTSDGRTSTHIGLKWGAALLHSDFQDVVDDLQVAGVVDASLDAVPAVQGEAETLKVLVLMADGENTESYVFDEGGSYVGDNSDLYRLTWQETVTTFDYAWRYKKNGVDIRYSYDESRCSNDKWTCEYTVTPGPEQSAYYLYDSYWDEWLDTETVGPDIGYWWNSQYWVYDSDFEDFQDDDDFVSLERLSWEEAWGLMTPDYVYDYSHSGPWNDYRWSSIDSGTIKDTQMQAICAAAKSGSVVIYTIGYEITAGGNAETQLEGCASSLNHYYPADSDDISAAFNSIASNVKNLRLTQ